ncbi:MAG: carotenoid oxygenase family protein [Deltaproteobacteria bacterium]|nr:carotenoid oxygenase family protein [Deltaproteobacteria bacterium]
MKHQHSIPRSLNRADRKTLKDAPVRIVFSTHTDDAGNFVLPEGCGGHFFTISAAGDVSSQGLPRAPKASTTVFNGDGYIVRLDLDDPSSPRLSAKLAGVPSLFADEITKNRPGFSTLKFNNFGVSRFSMQLGMRNTVNTAFVPIAKDPEGRWKHARLLIAIDAGRPWEIDTRTLDCVTPVGRNDEWRGDGSMGLPFPTVFSTAHPIWDPTTNDGYMVNFGKGLLDMPDSMPSVHGMKEAGAAARSRARRFFDAVGLSIVGRIKDRLKEGFARAEFDLQEAMPFKTEAMTEFLHLIQWDGVGELKKWQLFRRGDNVPVKVVNSLHQVQLSENHIIVMDTGFQVGMSSVVSQPVPDVPVVDAAFRDLVSRRPDPYLRFYIVRRADLEPGGAATGNPHNGDGRVPCTVVTLPAIAMHFTVDYKERDGLLWMTVCHSSGTCIDGWVADYDQLATNLETPPKGVMGMLPSAAGLSRLAHYAIHPDSGALRHGDVMMREPFQWETALYASPQGFTTHPVPERIEATWWFGFGIWPEVATVAVLDEYAQYPLRMTPRDHVLEDLEHGGCPSSLFRFEHDTSSVEDYYVLDEENRGCVLVSPQWIPKAGADAERSDSKQPAWLMTVVFTGEEKDPAGNWIAKPPEFWLFDAWNLAAGPQCKMVCDDLEVGFTFHTAWLEEIAPWEGAYKVDVRKDYQDRFTLLTSPMAKDVVNGALDEWGRRMRERERPGEDSA